MHLLDSVENKIQGFHFSNISTLYMIIPDFLELNLLTYSINKNTIISLKNDSMLVQEKNMQRVVVVVIKLSTTSCSIDSED